MEYENEDLPRSYTPAPFVHRDPCFRCKNHGTIVATYKWDKTCVFGFRCCNWSDFWAPSKGGWTKVALPQWDHSKARDFILDEDLDKDESKAILLKLDYPLKPRLLEEAFESENWEHPLFLRYKEVHGRDAVGKLYLEWKDWNAKREQRLSNQKIEITIGPSHTDV